MQQLPLSRRDLLKAGLAGAVATPWWIARPSGFQFAYFSDTHIGLDRNIKECQAMLTEMQGVFRPEFAINGGDVTDYGWEGEYRNYRSLVGQLPFKTYENPGNHDVRWSPLGMQVFRKHLTQPYRSFEHEGVLFVILDSTVPLSHWGHFESKQLAWLGRELERVGRDTPVILATHHWVGRDRVMIDNEEALRKLIEPYQVALILTGHGHSDLLWNWDGIPCTMNKGLYQGSYQRVTVNRAGNRLWLERRTTAQPRLEPLLDAALTSPQRSRAIYALDRTVWAAGAPISGKLDGVTEARWNQGPFEPVATALAKTAQLVPGPQFLTVRTGADQPGVSLPVTIQATPSHPLQLAWTTALPGGVMSHLRLFGEWLFVSTMDGSILAIDKASGQIVWKATTDDYCHSSPCIDNATQSVIVGSADSFVYSFELNSGKLRWKFITEGPVYAGAATNGKVVGIASGDGRVYGLDAATGAKRWAYELPKSNTNFSQSAAATDGERFFVGAWDNQLYAIDAATGEKVWQQPCNPRTFAFSPAIGSPHFAGDSVYISANGNGLFRFDAKTGEKRWEISSPGEKYGHSGPVLSGDRVVAGCLGDKGEVRCVQASDGKELWCCATGAVIYDSSPSIAGDFVAIGSVDATLNLIRLSTGELLGQHRLPPGHFLSKPVSEPGRVYAANFGDAVCAFDVASR